MSTGIIKDVPLGSIGHLGTYSFHDTKNYTSGEGGALCINDSRLLERAEIIRDKGTNRQQFFRGAVDKYTWVDIGSSYVPSEILMAFLCGQLEMIDPIAERRGEIFELYREHLSPLASEGLLRGPVIPAECQSNHHMYYILLPESRIRDEVISHLGKQGILAVFHFVPLHSSPMGRQIGYHEGDLPVTERLSGCLVRLPFYCDITEDNQLAVVNNLYTVLGCRSARPQP